MSDKSFTVSEGHKCWLPSASSRASQVSSQTGSSYNAQYDGVSIPMFFCGLERAEQQAPHAQTFPPEPVSDNCTWVSIPSSASSASESVTNDTETYPALWESLQVETRSAAEAERFNTGAWYSDTPNAANEDGSGMPQVRRFDAAAHEHARNCRASCAEFMVPHGLGDVSPHYAAPQHPASLPLGLPISPSPCLHADLNDEGLYLQNGEKVGSPYANGVGRLQALSEAGSDVPPPTVGDQRPPSANIEDRLVSKGEGMFPGLPLTMEDLEELTRSNLLEQIPFNEHGEMTSLGSIQHANGKCLPCLFWFKGACAKAVQCSYCHVTHPGQKNKRIRPSKKTRLQMRKAQEAGPRDNDDEGEDD